MAVDVVMPQMGESIFEGTITKWLKKPGDTVKRDEPLFEISTDKGIKGYGMGGPGGGPIVTDHLSKLLMNEDPFNTERICPGTFSSMLWH